MSPESETDTPGEATLPGTLPDTLRAELVAFRRDLHMHPELGNQEFRTTAAIKERLQRAGLQPRVLPVGTGLVCDIGAGTDRGSGRADRACWPCAPTSTPCPSRTPRTTAPTARTVPDRAHACGHDVHTTVVLGTGLVLAALHEQGLLPRPVRLVFQPAEEVLPGGAADAIEGGALDGVRRILAVHCDPRVDAGKIGLRAGPITSACDRMEIALNGPGGHTARPHLTTDLVTAAARVATDVPALVARRVDSRSGLALTWGRIESGHAPERHPPARRTRGHRALPRPRRLAAGARPGDGGHRRDRQPVPGQVRDHLRPRRPPGRQRGHQPPSCSSAAMVARRGTDAVESTEQSLGGEDFSWYLEHVPGAMARLGVRPPGERTVRDLHQGDFDVDEHAITVGVEMFTAAALIDAVQ
ncbi:Amidohydrolase OS=Streptomyces tendae OX=1932 GN=GUR47_16355 PE=4 SV=1 [Streptomyces tendae]